MFVVGLRSWEVWTVEKEDINWQATMIYVRGKGNYDRIEPYLGALWLVLRRCLALKTVKG